MTSLNRFRFRKRDLFFSQQQQDQQRQQQQQPQQQQRQKQQRRRSVNQVGLSRNKSKNDHYRKNINKRIVIRKMFKAEGSSILF